jgi:hypothetical protein
LHLCNFALEKDFSTPSTGFKSIYIKDPVHIDGKGVAVIDAHSKTACSSLLLLI